MMPHISIAVIVKTDSAAMKLSALFHTPAFLALCLHLVSYTSFAFIPFPVF